MAFAAERITSTVGEIIHAAAALDDMAEKTGASVEGLSRLTQIAKIGGIEFGQVETALVRLTKALSGTDDESKGAGKALDALGLSFKQLRGQAPEQALETVAKAFNQFEDGAGKTSIALALFGKAGAELLPLLKDIANTQGIVAKVTAEQAAQAEAAEKALARFKLEAGAAAQALTLQFLPALTKSLEELEDGTRIFGGFWSALNNIGSVNPFQNTQQALRGLGDDLAKLNAMRDKLKGWDANDPALSGINEKIATLQKQIEFYRNKAQRDALAGAAALGDTAGERRFGDPNAKRAASIIQPDGKTGKEFDESALRIAFLRENVHLLDKDLAAASKAYADWIKNVDAVVGPITRQADTLERLNEIYGLSDAELARKIAAEVEEAAVLAELNGAYESQVKQLRDVAAAHRRVADASDKAKLNAALAETATGKLEAQRKDMQFFAEALERNAITEAEYLEIVKSKLGLVADETKRTKTVTEEFGLVLVSEAERAVAHWQGFGNLMKSIGADLRQMAARKLITEPLGNYVNSVFSSGGAGSSGSNTGSLINAGSSLFNLAGASTAATSAYTAFAFSSLGSSLGLSTAGTIMGATQTGAALSGGLTAGGSALGALAAAAPYIAAVVAIASLFMGKGGGPKTEGSFDTKNIERFFTDSNSDAQAKDFVSNLQKSYVDLAKKFGGEANKDLRLAFGFALDPQGDAPNAAHLAVGTSQFIRDAGRPEDFQAQAAEYLNRGILEALKQTDLYDQIDALLVNFDPFTATSDQVNAELQAIADKMNELTAAGQSYAGALGAIGEQMQSVNNLFADSIRNVKFSTADQLGKYKILDEEAARYMDVLRSISDPTLIGEYAKKLDNAINGAFSLLSPEQQAAQADAFIGRFQQADALAQDRLKLAADPLKEAFANLPKELKSGIEEAFAKIQSLLAAAIPKGIAVDFRANVPGTSELSLIG